MPSRSKTQQRLMGMVYAYKNGDLKLDKLPKSLAEKIKNIADGSKRKTGDKRKKTKGITKKAAKEYASTKHDKLPQKISENNILKFNNFITESKDDKHYMDALKGGNADGMSIEEIAKIHDIPVDYIELILPIAIEIELEHTNDENVAKRIALDHIHEFPEYYDDKVGLPNMEKELEELTVDEIKDIINDKIEKVKKFDEFNETIEESRTNFSDKKCASCGKELTKSDDVILYNKDLIHSNTNCVWDYSKNNNIKLKRLNSMKLKDAIKELKKREGKRNKS